MTISFKRNINIEFHISRKIYTIDSDGSGPFSENLQNDFTLKTRQIPGLNYVLLS